jgi:hypothetical protein
MLLFYRTIGMEGGGSDSSHKYGRQSRFLRQTPDRGNPPSTPLRSVRSRVGRCSSAAHLDAISMKGLPVEIRSKDWICLASYWVFFLRGGF